MVINSVSCTSMHSVKYSCLRWILLLIVVIRNTKAVSDSNDIDIVLMLETRNQEQDLNGYKCKVKQSRLKDSKVVNDLVKREIDAMTRLGTEHNSVNVLLPHDGDFKFIELGFNDMCNYLQNNEFDQDYSEHELPMPLFKENSNDFYNHLKQLTNQEIVFMKQLESFEDDSDNTDNPFDIDMTRMNNLFKIAYYLQMKRLLTIIAARQASLMMNMNKQQMIQWLMDSQNTQKPMIGDKNEDSNNDQCGTDNSIKDNNSNNAKMVPLLSQKRTCKGHTNIPGSIHEIKKYHSGLLTHILSFFSCYDVNTFSSISNAFYDFAADRWRINMNVDPLIKVLTNNEDATCLSLTDQEVLFYKPFLTIPQYKWNENQNNTYNQLETMVQYKINFRSRLTFEFRTIVCFGGRYKLHTLECTIGGNDDSIEIRRSNTWFDQADFGTISFKFGKFTQQLNVFAQSRNIKNIEIHLSYLASLTSFGNLIGINDINNIRTIRIVMHSFAFIDFEEIFDISQQLEYLEINKEITKTKTDTTKTISVKNMQFLSKMTSLKELRLVDNNLDSFDFDTLKELTNLREISVRGNKFNYKLDTQCLDLAFLDNLADLTELDLRNNQIECFNNFIEISKHSNLLKLDLGHNKLSSLDLNIFQRTNLQTIYLSGNKLGAGLSHDDGTSQQQSCLDFNSFNNRGQLRRLYLGNNEFQCIVNFESIQQHTQLEILVLNGNDLLSSLIDFTKFDESKPLMNNLYSIYFNNMNLKYTTMQNNNCLDFQFLKFMPSVSFIDFSNNKIECIDNVSILQRKDMNLRHFKLDSNNLSSFDFATLIGSNIATIDLTNNNLSFESLQNFNNKTLLQINPSDQVVISIVQGNDKRLQAQEIEIAQRHVYID